MRLSNVEQLQDNRRDAAKMSRPVAAAQVIADPTDFYRERGRRRIHLAGGGGEYHVDAQPLAESEIALQCSRISLEVLVPIELQRIDEDADDYELAVAAGLFDKPRMARVQRAHRRHQTD